MGVATRKGSNVCSVLPGMIPEAFWEVPSLLSGLASLSVGVGIGYLRRGSFAPAWTSFLDSLASSLPVPSSPCMPWGWRKGIWDPHPAEAQLGKNQQGSFKVS